MKYCIHCGKELSGHEKFCTKCGAAVENDGRISKKAPSHLIRKILIICIAFLVLGCGAFAAKFAADEVFMNSGRILSKMEDAVGDIKSVSFRSSIRFNGDFYEGGSTENADLSVDIRSDVSKENKTGRFDIESTIDGDTEKIEFYGQYNTDVADLYVCQDGEWEKASVALDEYMRQFFERDIDKQDRLDNILSNAVIEKTELNGAGVFMASMEADLNDGFAEAYEELIEEWSDDIGIEMSEAIDLFDDLPALKIKIYIDRKTYLPERLEIDAKDSIAAFMQNIVDLAKQYGETDIDCTINKSSLIVDIESYDRSDISIPQEAYGGYDNGVIN